MDSMSKPLHAGRAAEAGVLAAQLAKRLRDHVFSVGNTVDPADGYRAFRGRDPGISALMRKRGFPVPGSTPAASPASGTDR